MGFTLLMLLLMIIAVIFLVVKVQSDEGLEVFFVKVLELAGKIKADWVKAREKVKLRKIKKTPEASDDNLYES